jgi:Type I phosphodiesterase / nucleotide pyrophosphatase
MRWCDNSITDHDVTVGSLTEVLPSALAVLGMPDTNDSLGLRERLGDVDRIAVLLVDGMGYHLLPEAAPYAPTIADAMAGVGGTLTELSCTFPSTTPTSLVTLGTGALPGAHGVLGFTVNVPGTDRVLTHIAWRDDPDPRTWQPVPPLLDRAVAAGIASVVVARGEFAGSGLTRAAYGDTARFVAAARAEELAARMAYELRAGPGLVYGYHPSLDTIAHLAGIASRKWRRTARSVDRLITRVAEALPPGAALLVTADHGALDIPAEGRLDAGTDPRLRAGVRLLAGEPRVRYVHTLPGAAADVLDAWTAVLGDRATVLSREAAIDTGWFGPVSVEHAARIGDIVTVCHGEAVILATGYEPDAVATLVAFHGSNSPVETAIPLLAFTR